MLVALVSFPTPFRRRWVREFSTELGDLSLFLIGSPKIYRNEPRRRTGHDSASCTGKWLHEARSRTRYTRGRAHARPLNHVNAATGGEELEPLTEIIAYNRDERELGNYTPDPRN